MLNNKNLKSITYFSLACSVFMFSAAFASSNYICPQPALVAAETLASINQGLNEVTIHTDYGTLTARIENKEWVLPIITGMLVDKASRDLMPGVMGKVAE